MERFANAISRAVNNNTVINVFLLGCFTALAARSANQQEQIQALETSNDTMLQSNKTMKNTIWKSKQQLYAAAAAEPENSTFVPPLSTLKVIYGEAIAAPSSAIFSSVDSAYQGNGKSTASKIII